MVPVADKYGWNNPAAVPEVGLVIATMSLAVPSALAVRERVRQIKAAKATEAAAASQPAAAGADDGG